MLIEQQIKNYTALDQWFLTSLGLSVAEEIRLQFKPVLEYLKGDTLLQLGNCGQNSWLNEFSFHHKWIASPVTSTTTTHLTCALNHTPLNRNSLDCVLLPLTLEPFNNSLSLIDEIDRILKPMGFVVFISFNPWSLWGGAMKGRMLGCYGNHKIKMRSAFNLNRIFIQRGYRQCSLNNFCYIPPVSNQLLFKQLNFFDEVGKMLWPLPSGFYCYIAQKFEYISPSLIVEPLTPPLSPAYTPTLQPLGSIHGYCPKP